MRKKIFLMLTICLSAMIFSTTATAQQNFSVSLNGVQVVPMRATNGQGSCLVKLNSTETQFIVNCAYSGTTSAVVGAHIHDAGPVGVNGPIRFNFNYTGAASGTIGPLTFDVTPRQVADLRAKRWYVNIQTSMFTNGEIRGQVKVANTQLDIDGDGRTNIAVFRQSANTIYVLDNITNNITAYQFGSGAGDSFLPTNDFDGDGRTELNLTKIIQPSGVGLHSMLQTGSNTIRTVQWGNFTAANNDRLVYGDYDGDGKQDIGSFRIATGVWYILESSTNTGRAVPNFGAPGDSPVVGDYDKDGKTDIVARRNVSGQYIWYIYQSSNQQARAVTFGAAGDQ